MEEASPRRSIVGLGIVAAALSLVVLWPGGAGAVHTGQSVGALFDE